MDVLDWLLDPQADPAIRWQVMRDLTSSSTAEVAAERARVARTGWGATVLAAQDPDGRWDGGTYRPGWVDESRPFFDAWTATHFALVLLRELGVDPEDPHVAQAVERVRMHVDWGSQPGDRYFDGEVEPCINGLVLANGVAFRQDMDRLVRRSLASQLPDGGWNCWDDARVSSFHSTMCMLEGLLAWEVAGGSATEVTAARHRGEAYLLERGLFRRRSDGRVVDPRFTLLSFPCWWYYDVLRGLDHLRAASRHDGTRPDARCAEAVELLRAKQDGLGRWPHESTHEGPTIVQVEVSEGAPSRWATLRATRVLAWWGGAVGPVARRRG